MTAGAQQAYRLLPRPLPRPSPAWPQAHSTLDGAARLALSALCRSSLLRLRADAFGPVLDDLPLPRSTQVGRQPRCLGWSPLAGSKERSQLHGRGACLAAAVGREGSTHVPNRHSCRLLLPMQGSSVLTAKAYVDNFGHLTAAQSSAVAPLFADPQVRGAGGGRQPARNGAL